MSTQLDTRLLGLGQIIAGDRHTVPVYQRSYAWKDQQINELFDDVAAAIHADEDEYFLGSIVLTNAETDRPQVVDGQQRLATTIILIGAIRDYLLSKQHDPKAEEIGRKYLASRDLRTDELVPRLELNSIDNEFFVDRIVAPPGERNGVKPIAESHRRIERAAELAKKQVESVAASAGSRAIENLIDWIEFVHQKAKVIRVSVPSHANAFTIFETLNDRGLPLAITDLLKNFLFSQADDRLAEVQSSWIAMASVLESVGGDEIVVDYVRHLWTSKYGLVRERQLYKSIRDRINSKGRCVSLATDLENRARTYCAIFNASHPFWRPYGDVARGYIAAINHLQVREIRPLLLAVITEFSETKTVRALRLLVSCIVRSLVVSGRGGIMESHYAAAAMKISDKQVTTDQQLLAELRDAVPSDQEFREAFSIARSSNSIRVRYFLREIERYLNSDEPEWVPSESADDVSLEHVLPRTLSDDWEKFDEDSHRTYVRRLGNLAIMSSQSNSEIGNASFEEKKAAFRTSSFQMTASIADSEEWGPDEIQARQEHLANLAAKTWPMSSDRRRSVKKEAATKKATKKSKKTAASSPKKPAKESAKKKKKKKKKKKRRPN